MKPELTADMLAKNAPDIRNLTNIHAKTLTNLPNGSLSFKILLDTLGGTERQAQNGAQGIVIVQETDTLLESAFLLSLYWNRPKPLVKSAFIVR